MSWSDKLFGWLRQEPDEDEGDELKDAEADQIDERYGGEKVDTAAEFRLGRGMGDSNR